MKVNKSYVPGTFSKGCFALVLLIVLAVTAPYALAETGDVNGDGAVDARDSMALRNYLVGNPGGIRAANADINADNQVDMKDIVLLERLVESSAGNDSVIEPVDEGVAVQNIVYGQSESGRDLVCTIIEPKQYSRTILSIFAIHGFEDWYAHDGQELVETAQLAIEHFQDPEALADCRLMIVPLANPDGLYDGTTNNGFGRCNASGIDLNRDFDAAHVSTTSARNYTLYPFSAPESRALRDLVNAYAPDIVLDCHGWENCTIGDSELASVFYAQMGLQHRVVFSDNAHGYFSYWAHQQGALALLVEFSEPGFDRQGFLNAMERLAKGDYDDETGAYEPDGALGGFTGVKTYALSTGKVPTYLDFDGDQAGSIYGSEDLCTIQKFYKNGYVRVSYPIPTGQKTAYCPLEDFIAPGQRVDIAPVSFESNQTVYRRGDLSQSIGTVYATDVSYCVARADTAIQIIYPLDAGGWKMGWVPVGTVSFGGNVQGASLAQAAEGRLEASGATAAAGREFDMPLSLQAGDIIAARLWLLYDASILTLEDVMNGDCLESLTLNENKTSGMYCMLWADSLRYDPRALSGTLAIPRFRIADGVSPRNVTVQALVLPGNALDSALNEVPLESLTIPVVITEGDAQALYLPEGAIVIEAEAFAGNDYDTVYLTSPNLVALGERAFANCKRLRSVYIAPGVVDIADNAFSGCGELTIFGQAGSAAEAFALKEGMAFIAYDFES